MALRTKPAIAQEFYLESLERATLDILLSGDDRSWRFENPGRLRSFPKYWQEGKTE